MEYLKSKNIQLRPLEMGDLNLLYEWENNPLVWSVSNTPAPYSKHVLQQYIESAGSDIYSSKQLRLVIEKCDNKKAIGFIDLFEFDPYNSKVGVGILIAESQERNKGWATESLELILQYVNKHLGVKQIYCNITVDNNQSIQLFENAGFVLSGIKRDWIRVGDKWLDEALYQLIFQ